MHSDVSGTGTPATGPASSRAVLTSAERLRVWSQPDVVWQSSLDRSIAWVSDSVQPTFGWDPADMIGRSYLDFFNHNENLDTAWRDEIRSAIYAGQSAYYETSMFLPDGSQVDVAGFVNPHFDLAGAVDGFQVGISKIDCVRARRATTTSAVDWFETRLAHSLDESSRSAVEQFLDAVDAGAPASLVMQVPDRADSLTPVFAAAFTDAPPVHVIERFVLGAIGTLAHGRSHVRGAAEALVNGGAVVLKIPAGGEPATVRAYSHTARISVEDEA